MFATLLVIVAFELHTFGGVQRESWLAALLVSCIAFAVLFLIQIVRGEFDYGLGGAVAGVLLLSLMTGPQFATAMLAGVWTWHASRKAPKRIIRFFQVL